MIELLLIVFGVCVSISGINAGSTDEDPKPPEYIIGQDRIDKMERDLDRLHQVAKDRLRTMR